MKFYKITLITLSFVMNTALAADTISLTLDRAESLAIKRNERSKISALELKQAKLNYEQARSGLFPTIKAELSTQKYSQNPSLFEAMNGSNPAVKKYFDNYNQGGTISIVQPVYTFGRLSGAINAAEKQSDLSQLNQKITIANIKSTIRELYFNALFFKKLYKISEESYENALANKQALQKRVSYGRISQRENLKMKADLYSRKPSLIEAQRQYEFTLSRIKTFLKINQSTVIELNETMESFNSQTLKKDYKLSNLALSNILKDQVSLYESLESIQKSDFYPSLGFFGSYGRTWSAEDFMGDSFLDQETVAVGLNLSWNFSSGGEKSYAHQKAKVQTQIKELEYQEGQRNLDENLKNLYFHLSKLKEKKKSLLQAVNVAKQSYKASLKSFSNGSLSQTQLNDGELLLTQNKIALAQNDLEVLLIKNQIKTYSTEK